MADTAKYDLNLILDPSVSEAQVQTEKDAVMTQLERAGGTLVQLDEWGMRRLAYPIRKGNEGYFLIYRLELPLDKPKTIEASLRQRDNVMRILVVKDRPEWKTRKAKPVAEGEGAPA